MTTRYQQHVRRHCRPLEPIPTGREPALRPLDGIRAVLFDVYGTLLVSGAGEVGTTGTDLQESAFREVMESAGAAVGDDGAAGAREFLETIGRHRQRMLDGGIDTPEVDIIDVWRDTLSEGRGLRAKSEGLRATLGPRPSALGPWPLALLRELAVEYECRVNPVWPMPHARSCLEELRAAGMRLGIISNAQFFTLPILAELFGATPDQLGFESELTFLSYEHRRAKPGPYLFELACDALRTHHIAAGETLFIGNDLLHDVLPASQAGFRTALFAGDRRSLRLRDGEERVRGVTPDLILTELSQLPSCVCCGKL